MPVPLLWLILALGFAGAEVLTGSMYLLMLGGGALAAAGSSWLFNWPIWAGGVVFAVVSILLLAGVRPALRRRLTGGEALTTGVKALEGKTALVVDRIGQHEGQVKLDGEIWTARPLNDDDVYEPGDHVTVMHIDGATAVVWKNAI
jgi:membrane protein implicated in regulation of membrane protease activity